MRQRSIWSGGPMSLLIFKIFAEITLLTTPLSLCEGAGATRHEFLQTL
jgi:hypothetical protein